ncbi:DUF2161 family putative PD-(D/E)XK-type phosphodiesterase [Neobacillus sp. OS1-33]|uniref:DUF2161 domain-containing phosphodiesterase n=1 Tax=Neobacillus sp. OS1-33 TaxID=3070683 RepID=UPI0027DF3C40|nr:DUF2161 family putative PD-(D/E)XK-type phosphodiesterase [Neobacillus sp. OS1-33]WML26471.1 DUF2161 family putative PD-(D/E)XK-type phosphodiesterase [Neobacillus sp. OS1-33]
MKETKKLLEIDLYKPIQTHFVREGYKVYGEVKDCDIVALRDEELVVIELKLNLTVDLLMQAAKRQRITDKVYVAIPKPKHRLNSKQWSDKIHLIRRLELGLIVVSSPGKSGRAEIIFEPTPFQRRKNKRKRDSILKEINGRSADYNIGGSNRTKIMTAYKENCIQIACYLENLGPLAPRMLIQLGSGKNTSSILTKNYYGWFERIKRGTYVITEKGKEEMKEYSELVTYYLSSLGDENDT